MWDDIKLLIFDLLGTLSALFALAAAISIVGFPLFFVFHALCVYFINKIDNIVDARRLARFLEETNEMP